LPKYGEQTRVFGPTTVAISITRRATEAAGALDCGIAVAHASSFPFHFAAKK
jgi:hypothetical protein